MMAADDKRPPHQRINFNLRPNKHIERRMIVDVLSQLSRFEDLSRYAYIGMGSYYFADFVMMHKALGIQAMYSIEFESEDRARFQFNAPFGCITVLFGSTHQLLPTLDIFERRPVIVWLDYYGYLDDAKLGDVQHVVSKCMPGSALLVTVNASTPSRDQAAFSKFKQGLAIKNRPPNHSAASYSSNRGFGEMCRAALRMRISSTLAARKAGLSARQIFNFRYRDGSAMATYGWIFPTKEQNDLLGRSPQLLENYPVATGEDVIDIDAPTLTFKEIAHLRTKLPGNGDSAKYLSEAGPIDREDAEQFSKISRYFPSFAHIEE